MREEELLKTEATKCKNERKKRTHSALLDTLNMLQVFVLDVANTSIHCNEVSRGLPLEKRNGHNGLLLKWTERLDFFSVFLFSFFCKSMSLADLAMLLGFPTFWTFFFKFICQGPASGESWRKRSHSCKARIRSSATPWGWGVVDEVRPPRWGPTAGCSGAVWCKQTEWERRRDWPSLAQGLLPWQWLWLNTCWRGLQLCALLSLSTLQKQIMYLEACFISHVVHNNNKTLGDTDVAECYMSMSGSHSPSGLVARLAFGVPLPGIFFLCI